MPTDVFVATKGENAAVFSTMEAMKTYTKWAPGTPEPMRNVPETWNGFKVWGPVTIDSPARVITPGGRRRTRRRRTTRKH